MSEAVKSELYFFLISVLAGAMAAVIFDFFRSLRKCREEKKKIVALEDIFFWISEAILTFAVLYNFNSGQIRFYFFLGLAVGAVIYLLTASRIVIWVFTKVNIALKVIFCTVLKFLRKTIKIISAPALFLLKRLKAALGKFCTKAKKIKKQLKMY